MSVELTHTWHAHGQCGCCGLGDGVDLGLRFELKGLPGSATQIIMRAAEQQHRARPGAPPLPSDAGLPAPSADHPLPVRGVSMLARVQLKFCSLM